MGSRTPSIAEYLVTIVSSVAISRLTLHSDQLMIEVAT